MALPEDFQQRLNNLRGLYLKDLPGKLDELEQAFIAAGNRFDELLVPQRLAHSLAGSGGTFGVAVVSTVCRKIENQVASHRERQTAIPDEIRGEILLAIDTLRQTTREEPKPVLAAKPEATLVPAPAAAPPTPRKKICLIEEDPQIARDLCTQLGYFGYDVNHVTTPAAYAAQGQPVDTQAILCDVGFPGQTRSSTLMTDMGKTPHPGIPLVFISARDDLQARLEAVRSGCVGYLTKPVDITQLVTLLDNLTLAGERAAIKVLVVDDSPELGRFHVEILQHSGMQARALHQPSELLAALRDFKPDLVLMDMYMPDCTGVELTRVIRQQEAYVGLPIVYLSAEQDMSLQLEAMSSGADDFLLKPIKPDHLVASIRSRTARHAHLRAFIVKDSLTNLLNHSRLREALDVELSRAIRNGRPVAFAMLDLDHFKSVNDNYGHPAGDQVLRALARMLTQRLRKTDISGRYGGEEFGVILPDTDAATALRVIDTLREDFSQIRHLSGDKEFRVTFSAGIAEFPAVRGVDALGRAADVALYEAKRKGRNRVETLLVPKS